MSLAREGPSRPIGWLTASVAAIAALLAFIAPASEARMPRTPGPVDLLTGFDLRLDGAAGDDRAGSAVAAAGDVNGDGLGDVIVGSPMSDNNGRAESGSAYVLFGRRSTATVDSAALGASGFRIDGAAVDDRAGRSVAGIGDFNRDGLDDVIVGRGDPNNAETGYAHVVFGSRMTNPVDLAALGNRGFRIDGTAGTTERAGLQVAAGDVNGDGRPDLLVAAPFAAVNGLNDNGSVYVVFGRPGIAGVDLGALGNGGFRIDGTADNMFAGLSGVAAGDVNGDGRDDVVLAEPSAGNNGRAGSGSAYAVLGASSTAPVDLRAPGSRGFRVDGAAVGDAAGTSVGVAGDMTGDARAEVVVGAPMAGNNGRAASGSTYLVFGRRSGGVDLASLGSRGSRVDGPVAGALLGSSAGGAGDVNRDGRGEAVAGAPGDGANARAASGSAFLPLGNPRARTIDGAQPAAVVRQYIFSGAAPGEMLGAAPNQVAPAGDVNGDLRDDLVVASVEADNNGRMQSGSGYVVFGPRPRGGTCTNPFFGTSRADIVSGTSAGESFHGRKGSDRFSGGRGADCASGDQGNDRLTGGRGRDKLGGDSGNDRINARDGRGGDRVNCGSGSGDRASVDAGDSVARNCEVVRVG